MDLAVIQTLIDHSLSYDKVDLREPATMLVVEVERLKGEVERLASVCNRQTWVEVQLLDEIRWLRLQLGQFTDDPDGTKAEAAYDSSLSRNRARSQRLPS